MNTNTRKKREKRNDVILTPDFYRVYKNHIENLNKNYRSFYSTIDSQGKVVKGNSTKGSNRINRQLYFYNIDKIRSLNIHDLKFIIENMLLIGKELLKKDEVNSAYFSSLEFKKNKRNQRGVKMALLKKISNMREQGKDTSNLKELTITYPDKMSLVITKNYLKNL